MAGFKMTKGKEETLMDKLRIELWKNVINSQPPDILMRAP